MPTSTLIITPSHHAAYRGVAKASHPQLGCLRVSRPWDPTDPACGQPATGQWTATVTDGKWLTEMPVTLRDPDPEWTGLSIQMDPLPRKREQVTVEIPHGHQSGPLIGRASDGKRSRSLTVTVTATSDYPDFRRILRDAVRRTDGPTVTVTLNPALLMQAAAAMADADHGVTLTIPVGANGETTLDPMVVRGTLDPTVTSILMPIRARK